MHQKLTFQPPVIAHRGASAYAPENTMAAFKKAAELGVKWVEFDVMLSADGEPIIFHDETLDRTTNAKGDIAICRYDYLATLDAGAWYSDDFSGQHIPTLKEVMQFLLQYNLCANVEIKPLPGQERETAIATLKVVESFFPQPNPAILFSSFSTTALMSLREQSPDCYMGLLLEEWTSGWELFITSQNCISVNTDEVILDEEKSNIIKKLGRSLLCYTVNDPQRAKQLYQWGVDAVFSDMPDRILASI